MERRITFFISSANPTSDGWIVSGESGLGPPQEGDAFTFVHHEDDHTGEDGVLRVVEATPQRLRLVAEHSLRLRAGDILAGEGKR